MKITIKNPKKLSIDPDTGKYNVEGGEVVIEDNDTTVVPYYPYYPTSPNYPTSPLNPFWYSPIVTC